jgi:hypothetical protein
MEIKVEYSEEVEREMAIIKNLIKERYEEFNIKIKQLSRTAKTIQSGELERLVNQIQNDQYVKELERMYERLLLLRVPKKILIINK